MIPKTRTSGLRNLAFFSALIAIASLAALTFETLNHGKQHAELVRRTYLVLKTSQTLQASINGANAAHRGYAISGDSSFLQPLIRSEKDSNALFVRLRNLTASSPEQQSRVSSLIKLFHRKHDQMAKTVQIRNSKGVEPAMEYISTGGGKAIMDSIRSATDEFDREELALLQVREAEAEKALKRIRSVLLIGTTLSLTIIILTFLALQKQIKRRRESEFELFSRNQWFTQTLFSLGDAVITTDIDGNITMMNRAASEIMKWDEKDAVGKHIDDVVILTAESNGKKVLNPAMDAIKRNEIAFLETSTLLERKDGYKVTIDDSGAPIHDQNGEIIGAVLIFRDVTDKRRAEKELSLFHELSSDLIGIADAQGRFTRINPSFNKTLGFQAADFLSGNYIDFVHPEDIPKSVVELRNVRKGNSTQSFINRFKCADGNFKWLEWNITSLDETIYAAARDITERHLAGEELQTAYRQFYQILESNPVAIMITDCNNSKIKYVNESLCNLLGLERADMIGRKADELGAFEALDCNHLRKKILDSGGRERNLESVFRGQDKNVDVLFSVETIEIDNTDCFVSSFVDITQRKRSEQEVIGLNEILEKRVAERTSELVKQKRFTDQILNKMPIEIAVYDKEMNYLYVNPEGIADEKARKWIIGRNDLAYGKKYGIDPAIIAKRAEAFELIKKGMPAEWVDEIADDQEPVKYKLRILQRLSGTQSFMLTGIDITHLKNAERKKQQYIDGLEEMMFITSHKVRHPVAQIVSLAMLLNEDLSQDELKEIVAYSKDSIAALETFTRELTMFIHDLKKKNIVD